MNKNTSYNNIPDELKELKQWVCVDKNSKIPKQALNGECASSTNPSTWSDYITAIQAVDQKIHNGIGFVFNDNGIVGIDIDYGYDDDGLMNSISADIIGKCQSYTEISQSGRGFHIFLSGNLPFNGKNNSKGLEIYKTARYFIMTGNTLLYRKIIDNQGAINYILDKYFTTEYKINKSSSFDKIYKPVWDNFQENGKIKIKPDYPKIARGNRNICLCSLAGMLHNQGYSRANIYDELLYCNTVACNPPLDKAEIKAICNSITKYRR